MPLVSPPVAGSSLPWGRMAVRGGPWGWVEGRQLFIDLLEGSNPSKAIEQLAERMQWCIQKEGWPFESFMKKQKCDK